MFARQILVIAVLPFGLAAQDLAGKPLAKTRIGVEFLPPPDRYVAFSPLQKLNYNIGRTFDAGALSRTALSTGIDHWMDVPEPWPGQMHGLGVRFSSKMGHRLVRHVIMAGAQSVLRDDPRRLPTTATGFLPRARQTVLNTYRVQRDDGKTVRFNYSRVVAAYGSAFVSRTWHPPGYRSNRDSLMNGTSTLVIDAGMSVLFEFWPDIKRKVFRK